MSITSCSPRVAFVPPTTSSVLPARVRAYTLPSRSALRNCTHFGSRVWPSMVTAASRRERLAVDGLADRIDVEALGFLDRLLPHVDAEVRRLHRIVGDALVTTGQVRLLRVRLEGLYELLVVRGLDRLEVVPRREVADEGRGVHAAQLVLGDAVRHDRRVLRAQTLVREFLVERHVRVAVDRLEHAGAAAG